MEKFNLENKIELVNLSVFLFNYYLLTKFVNMQEFIEGYEGNIYNALIDCIELKIDNPNDFILITEEKQFYNLITKK